MPLDPISGSIIGEGLGSGINMISQMITNKQNLELQKEQWSREDTAVQRRVKDLEAAGLNKVLAAGGSGSPTSLTAQFKSPVDIDPGFYARGVAAKTASLNFARTEADTRRVSAEADAAEANAASAFAKSQVDTATARLLLQTSSEKLPEEYRGLTLLEAKTLMDLKKQDIGNTLTGTNQQYQQLMLELLKKYGSVERVMGIIQKGASALDILE